MTLRRNYLAVRKLSIIAAVAILASCGGDNPAQTPTPVAAPVTPPIPPPDSGPASAPVPASDPPLVTAPAVTPPVVTQPVVTPPVVTPPVVTPPVVTPPVVTPPVVIPPVVIPPVVPPSSTTLSASVSTLALSVNNTGLNAALTGTPRSITITNTGSAQALAVAYSTSRALPSDASVSSTCAGTLAPTASCTITLIAGVIPTAVPGDTNPLPVILSIKGSNTNTLATSVNVLTYGSVYQSGYVFAIDDTTAGSASVGGKVAALLDTSTVVPWSPNTGITNATSLTDGAANTAQIITAVGMPLSAYAAGVCTATNGGFSDWYLPAPCEMGADASCPVSMQNMQSSLVDNLVSGGPMNLYWTSAEMQGSGGNLARQQFLSTGGGSFQLSAPKAFTEPLRCARIITN